MNWLFMSGGQSIGISALASVLPVNIQGWFPLGLAVLISLVSKILSRIFSSTTVWKYQFFGAQPSLWSNPNISIWLQEKKNNNIALTSWTFVGKVMSLLFNMLSRFVSFSSKKQASFNFMAAVTVSSDFGAQEKKICHCFHFFPIYLSWSDRTRYRDLSFFNVEF